MTMRRDTTTATTRQLAGGAEGAGIFRPRLKRQPIRRVAKEVGQLFGSVPDVVANLDFLRLCRAIGQQGFEIGGFVFLGHGAPRVCECGFAALAVDR
jgi:hypothetical protein